MVNHGRKTGPHQAIKHEPDFVPQSEPAKTAMDALKAILWIPDAVAKILLLVAVVVLGWQVWALRAEVAEIKSKDMTDLKMADIRAAEQRTAEMAILAQVMDEIKAYRIATLRNASDRQRGTR